MRILFSKICFSGFKTCRQSVFRTRNYHTKYDVYGHRAPQEAPCFRVSENALKNRNANSNLYRLVKAYRSHGHKQATVDPLGISKPQIVPELEPSFYGLEDTNKQYDLAGILNNGVQKATLAETVAALKQLYCGPLTAEFLHLLSKEEREWFSFQFEQIQKEPIDSKQRVDMAKLMLNAQAFDHFLANKFSSIKRYGGEGAESAMPFYDELFRVAAEDNYHDVLVCIAHRGRLNLLTCLLKFPSVLTFQKMKGKREFPEDVVGAGDVLSHLTSSVDLQYGEKNIHVSMVPNPSHLEAVNPVTVGKTRARQQSLLCSSYGTNTNDGAMCLQVHGDAAFAGQGVIAELFAMASVPHFEVGGSVHLIINNQIGYTTGQDRGRSSMYASCLAKTDGCPVIRVNGEYPEDVIRACRVAMAYKSHFRKDVIVDLVCFRRWGHNEMDEPAFTQPLMYDVIRNKTSIPDSYAQSLVAEGVCDQEELDSAVTEWKAHLTEQYTQIDSYIPKANHLEKQWSGMSQATPVVTTWDTGCNLDMLRFIGAKSVTISDDVVVHPTVYKTHVTRRLQSLEQGTNINWATAEALAMGSLMYQGYNVRISGQDVGRGTFAQRHAMVIDQVSDAIYIPLNHMAHSQTGFLEIANSILSEEAVMGFEFGMSIENPNILAIWEAQFGDFFNGAQIIIDTFITGSETKWLLQTGLVLLLPHGIDGAGPEHSSCRYERFLQLTDSKEDGIDGDDINLQVVNPTTPAQYFHVLRRQMVRNFRKPLVVISPKMLLRHPSCVSSLNDMNEGTSFQPVLPDSRVTNNSGINKVVFVCGKHYYNLDAHRTEANVNDTAIVRIEALCPFPAEEIHREIAKYPNAKDFIWAQEEHRNSGAWTFVAPRFENVVGKKLRYIGRIVHPTPATGVGEIHKKEAVQVVNEVFA